MLKGLKVEKLGGVLFSVLLLCALSGVLAGCAPRPVEAAGPPLAMRAVVRRGGPQGGGHQLIWEWDHARVGYEGCATPASGANCVGSFEWGLVEVDSKGVSTLRRVGVVDAVAGATTRQTYSADITLPAGIGKSEFYARALGFDRAGQPAFGSQGTVNVTVAWDRPENILVQ